MSGVKVSENYEVLMTNLGITEVDVRILLPIFAGGHMTAGGISLVTGEKIQTVRKALGRLEKKGLVALVEGIVPVYRALSPALASGESLMSLLDALETVEASSATETVRLKEEIDKISKGQVQGHLATTKTVRDLLEEHEDKMVEILESLIAAVTGGANGVLGGLSVAANISLQEAEDALDNDLGTKLTELQFELDKSQKDLTKKLRAVLRNFKKWLKPEKTTAVDSIAEFQKRVAIMVKKVKAAIESALTNAESSISIVNSGVLENLTSSTSDLAVKIVGMLEELMVGLAGVRGDFDSGLTAAYDSSRETIQGHVESVKALSADETETVRTSLDVPIARIEKASDEVTTWKQDALTYVTSAEHSLNSQLEQLASSDQSLIEIVKNTLLGHLDRVSSIVTDEYETLSSIVTSIEGEYSQHLDTTKERIVALVRKQLSSDQKAMDTSTAAMRAELDDFAKKASRRIGRRLSRGTSELGDLVEARALEFEAIAEKVSKKLRTSMTEIMTKATAANETLVAAVTKSTHKFETGVDSKLRAVMNQFASLSEQYVVEAETLYVGLNSRLDSRLGQTVKALTARMDRARNTIEAMNEDQMIRIDRQATGIRDEFHMQIEEITRQFVNLTQGLEAAFNGLLSSQIIETRDFISSTHTELNAAVKSEMNTLKEESAGLQQEYSSELEQKLDEVRDSAGSLRKKLEDVTSIKRKEMAESIQTTLESLETAVQDSQNSLGEIETSTMKQMKDDLTQLTSEFGASAAAARVGLSERGSSLSEAVENELEKSIGKVTTVAEARFAEQTDVHIRTLAGTSKSLDSTVTKLLKSLTGNLEAFQLTLTQAEAERVNAKSDAREEVSGALDIRRNEATMAVAAASAALEASVVGIGASIESLEARLSDDLKTASLGISKASRNVVKSLSQKTRSSLEQISQTGEDLIQGIAETYQGYTRELETKSLNSIRGIQDHVGDLPTVFSVHFEKSFQDSTSETRRMFGKVAESLATTFTETERASESASEELRGLSDRVSSRVTSELENVLDKGQEGAVAANQHAARMFESIGLSLKSNLSKAGHRLIEDYRGQAADKTLELTATSSAAKATVTDTTAAMIQAQYDGLEKQDAIVERSFRKWAVGQKKSLDQRHKDLKSAVKGAKTFTRTTVASIDAVREEIEGLAQVTPEKTWYVTGVDEVFAHIHDMASRATDSIIISVYDTVNLDVKRLSKVKSARRRVLIVPQSDEPDSSLEGLSGWRVWHAKSPPLVAVADNDEILIGGSGESEQLMSLISSDESYLHLFRDVIGPKIVAGRVP
ncbi:MAG: helix-turn-helix domain-containing protein [Candidatus Thorarchaeota archaeon]|jgi:sugar-specific transcriptional regulator TrmB